MLVFFYGRFLDIPHNVKVAAHFFNHKISLVDLVDYVLDVLHFNIARTRSTMNLDFMLKISFSKC